MTSTWRGEIQNGLYTTITRTGVSTRQNHTGKAMKAGNAPLPGEVLRDNGDEALQAAQDRAMDDDRAGHNRLVRRTVAQVEALRQLEVELDGRALEFAS